MISLAGCYEPDKKTLFDKVKEQLNLSAEQCVLVKPISDEQIEKVKEIIKESRDNKGTGTMSGSVEVRTVPLVERLQELSKEAELKLATILTAQQLEQYRIIVSAEIAKIKAHQDNPASGGRRGGRSRRGGGGGMGGFGGGF